MAAITHRVTTADTGATPNTSGNFTPAIGDLLVVIMAASATTDAAPTMQVSTTPPGTWALVATVQQSGGGNRLYVFVAEQFVTSATSRSVTGDTPNDASTGTVLTVYSISGMTKTGAAAVRQIGQQDNQASGSGNPNPAFSAAVLTSNPTIAAVMNSSNPANLNLTSWTEPAGADTGYASPTTGLQSCFRDSGFTGTAMTYDGASATAFGSVAIEFDASGDNLVSMWEPQYPDRIDSLGRMIPSGPIPARGPISLQTWMDDWLAARARASWNRKRAA